MKNSFIIDRYLYDEIRSNLMDQAGHLDPDLVGIRYSLMIRLSFFIIEEEDGSATFIKNRYNDKKFMNPEEYQEMKEYYETV